MISSRGNFQVCCLHPAPLKDQKNINSCSYEEWRDSDYLKEVQDHFRKDLKHPGCNNCWERESIGQVSYRNRIRDEYSILNINDTTSVNEYPVNIEINLGNLCNLKCLMCNESDSSAILAENIKLGINQYQQQDFHWSPVAFDHLKKIINHRPKVINIRGGETFYNKDLLDLINNLPEDTFKKSLLHITTNATKWSTQWEQALKKFRLVRLMLSIDATEDLYEYIRYPAVWDEVTSNVNNIKNNNNFKLLVNVVVQNLNILHLGKILNWCRLNDLHIQLDQLVDPDYLHICNLPHDKKQNAIEHLTHILTENHPEYINNFVRCCIDQLTDSLDRPVDIHLWEKFKENVSMRDNLRGQSYQKFL